MSETYRYITIIEEGLCQCVNNINNTRLISLRKSSDFLMLTALISILRFATRTLIIQCTSDTIHVTVHITDIH